MQYMEELQKDLERSRYTDAKVTSSVINDLEHRVRDYKDFQSFLTNMITDVKDAEIEHDILKERETREKAEKLGQPHAGTNPDQ